MGSSDHLKQGLLRFNTGEGSNPSLDQLARGVKTIQYGSLTFFIKKRGRMALKKPRLLLSDTPFEFLTYQLDGRVVAYHGYNG